MFIAVAGIFCMPISAPKEITRRRAEAAALTDENGAVENGTMQIGDDIKRLLSDDTFLIRINSPIPLLKR